MQIVKKPKEVAFPQIKTNNRTKRPLVRILSRPVSGADSRDTGQRGPNHKEQPAQNMSMSNSIAQWSNITHSHQNINVGPRIARYGLIKNDESTLSDLKEINMMQSNIQSQMKRSRHKIRRLDQLKFYSNKKVFSPRNLGNLVESNILSLEESLLKQKTVETKEAQEQRYGVLNLCSSDYMKSVINKNVKS